MALARGTRRGRRGRIPLVAVAAATTLACQPVPPDDGARDTVRLVDTVVRVDTVRIVDTVVALGSVPDETPPVVPPAGAADSEPVVDEADLAYLRLRQLVIPIAGVRASDLPDSFNERRGARRHEATDILAPRGTPILSADDGAVLKLHTSAGGGLTVYASDPADRFVYYYAHLDGYAPGLAEGQPLRRGQTIGFVGTTGNAPANTPHLHFAIAKLGAAWRWWQGTPIDARTVLR